MPTFIMTFGQHLANKIGHTGAPVRITDRAHHYATNVPYDESRLSEAGRRFLQWQAGRDLYPRRNPCPVSTHPDPLVRRAYAGLNDEWLFGPQPHASTVDDLTDCTDWLNAMAAESGFFDQ